MAIKLVEVLITVQNQCHHQNSRATKMALTHSSIMQSLTEKLGISLYSDTSDMDESEPEQPFVSVIHYAMYT